MNASLLLRIICLLGVITSGVLYFHFRSQTEQVEKNLSQSRAALQSHLEEIASLKSRALNAEEISSSMTQLAEEEKSKTAGYRKQFEELKQKAEEAVAAQQRAENELTILSAANRDMQRQVNTLKASIPPQNWREQLNQLQSRVLELEAENTSLKKSLASAGQTTIDTIATNNSVPGAIKTSPVGKVMRIGPDGSFAILSYGRQLGAAEGQVLTIHRGPQKVALVSLTQITNDFSIAQILSSTNTGNSLSVPDIQVGDTAHLQ